VVIKGLATVNRAMIVIDDSKGDTRYKVLVEGDNFRDVLATPGVKSATSTSNNTYEVMRNIKKFFYSIMMTFFLQGCICFGD